MRALTLHEPWASLIAARVKTVETRSRPARTLIGQRLAVHAGRRYDPEALQRFWPDLASLRPVVAHSERTDERTVLDFARASIDMPLGCIVASCVVTDVVPIVGDDLSSEPGTVRHRTDNDTLWYLPSGSHPADADNITRQLPYGDYRPGRWAYILGDIAPIELRCPWCWDRPPEAMPGYCVDIDGGWWHEPGSCRHCASACPVCKAGTRRRAPIPARGYQGVWEWDPTALPRLRDTPEAHAVAEHVAAEFERLTR